MITKSGFPINEKEVTWRAVLAWQWTAIREEGGIEVVRAKVDAQSKGKLTGDP